MGDPATPGREGLAKDLAATLDREHRILVELATRRASSVDEGRAIAESIRAQSAAEPALRIARLEDTHAQELSALLGVLDATRAEADRRVRQLEDSYSQELSKRARRSKEPAPRPVLV
jgi:hypothetical protein